MNHTTRTAATALCAALALGTAACDGDSTQASSATPTTSSTAPADPLAAMSAPAIAAKANADLKAALSVHLEGNAAEAGKGVTVDLELAPGKGCSGTVTELGAGSYQLVVIGAKIWIRYDSAALKKAGTSAAVEKLIDGRYIGFSTSDARTRSVATICDLPKSLSSQLSNYSGMTKGSATTVDGQRALNINDTLGNNSLIISDAPVPEVLQILDSGSNDGALNFSDYNAPVVLDPPPASETLDGSQYGF